MKTLKSKRNDCILITYCITSKSLQCTKAKWSNLSWAQLAVSFYFRKIIICMRLCLLDSLLSRLWFPHQPKNGKHNPSIVARVRLYMYTQRVLHHCSFPQCPAASATLNLQERTCGFVQWEQIQPQWRSRRQQKLGQLNTDKWQDRNEGVVWLTLSFSFTKLDHQDMGWPQDSGL